MKTHTYNIFLTYFSPPSLLLDTAMFCGYTPFAPAAEGDDG